MCKKQHIKVMIALVLLLLNTSLPSVAQKLPNIQKESIWAPANVAIDGKATEWGNFMAYNKATQISYTLCNDNENLYLAVQTDQSAVTNKIMKGGITLLIQKSGAKKGKDAMSINFPVCGKTKPIFVTHRKGDLPPPKELADHIADSIMHVNNNKLASNEKWIRTQGLTNIDTLISIYNTDGIRMANAFDLRKVYTCELSVNLKCLGLETNNIPKLAYHIIIKGESGSNRSNTPMFTFIRGTNADGTPKTQAQLNEATAQVNAIDQMLNSTTDFWGEYTLARK